MNNTTQRVFLTVRPRCASNKTSAWLSSRARPKPPSSGCRRCSTKTAPNQPGDKRHPRKSFLGEALARYSLLLETRPLTTKAVTSGIIAGAGDITCQLLSSGLLGHEDGGEEAGDQTNDTQIPKGVGQLMAETDIDWGRCARFTLLGAGLIAPALHYWYGYLTRLLPGTGISTVVKRVALDQFVFTPFFLATFLSSVMLVDGQAAKIAPKLKADFGPTLVGNWGYWIPAQLINFRYVAPAYQVLYANGCGFFWNIYLSFRSNKAVEDELEENDERSRLPSN